MEVFQFLADWYQDQCNGVWEKEHAVRLQSLKNPGWLLKIDLADTVLEHSPFQSVRVGLATNGRPEESTWMSARVHGSQFIASCSPDMLRHALDTFQLWSSLYADG